MHGRKCLLFIAALLLVSCSSKSLLSPDCHTCTAEDQSWKGFSWEELTGKWRGSLETAKNAKGAKKEKLETAVELRFLNAGDFLRQKNAASCGNLPANAMVLNGQLWNSGKNEFEAFVPVEEGKVAYGRLSLERVNNQQVCNFRRLGRVMGQNRLALPAVTFSENGNLPGRQLASAVPESDFSVEFLRFAPATVKKMSFQAGSRKPAAKAEEERPPLMIRVYKTSSRDVGSRGEWKGSEEQLYRLWKVE